MLAIQSCSFELVPPATKGKILGTAGYSADVLEPGKYTLFGRDRLVLLHTNTNTYKEQVKVLMKDKLTLYVDVRFRGRIAGSPEVIDSMFDDLSPTRNAQSGRDEVTFHQVYSVYGQMAVRNKTREIISRYNTEDVNLNYQRISEEVGAALVKEFKNTPMEVSDVALGDIAYPTVITEAVEAAKSRDLAIKKHEANARIELVKKENEMLLAKADYDIEITRAKTVKDANRILGEGITPALLELKRIEAVKLMATNERAVFLPVEAMSSTGAQMRMYQK